jgi:hypothetical protein
MCEQCLRRPCSDTAPQKVPVIRPDGHTIRIVRQRYGNGVPIVGVARNTLACLRFESIVNREGDLFDTSGNEIRGRIEHSISEFIRDTAKACHRNKALA